MVSSARAKYHAGMTLSPKQRLERSRIAIVAHDENTRPHARELYVNAPRHIPMSYQKLGRMFNRSAQTIKNWSDSEGWVLLREERLKDLKSHNGGSAARWCLDACTVIAKNMPKRAEESTSNIQDDALCATMLKLIAITEKSTRILEKTD